MFGLTAVVLPFRWWFDSTTALRSIHILHPISSLSIYLHTHITHKPSSCRTIYKSFCFPENWSLCFPFVFVQEEVSIYSHAHVSPSFFKSFFTPTLLTLFFFFYILYCLFYVPLFILRLSIVYLPLFLHQSFYLISPPPINPLPLSFARSPSSFLSHRAVSLSLLRLFLSNSLSLFFSFSLSLSLSLSLCMVRLFCGFDFLSDLHVPPLELL
jgi:hypothetical protein